LFRNQSLGMEVVYDIKVITFASVAVVSVLDADNLVTIQGFI